MLTVLVWWNKSQPKYGAKKKGRKRKRKAEEQGRRKAARGEEDAREEGLMGVGGVDENAKQIVLREW
jgi:hypothetical protein